MIASLWLIYHVTILNFDLCVMWPLLCITNLPPPLSHTYYTCPPPWLSTNGTKISFQTDHLIIPHILFKLYREFYQTKVTAEKCKIYIYGTQTCGRNKIYVYKGIKETWEVYTAKDRKQKCVLTGFLHWLECILLMPEQGVLLSFKRLAGSWSIREHATESFTRFRVIFEKQQNIFLISLTYLW